MNINTQRTPHFINQDTSSSDSIERTAPQRTTRTKRGLANTSKRWPDGVVTVSLDMRDRKNKALVIDVINEWAHNTPGLRFKIVNGVEGDIRISDDEGLEGNWSQVGTDARSVDKDNPTMHLNRNADSREFRSVVLHEFGHALGLEHEHQNPENTIDWNKDAVYEAYSSEDFPDEQVYEQILKLPTGSHLLVTSYDAKSVMHYEVPAEITNNGVEVPINIALSEGDRKIVQKLYTPGKFQNNELDA
jgi:hypothetical protein